MADGLPSKIAQIGFSNQILREFKGLRYIRQTGLTVDLVCHIHCGRTDGVIEAVYDANPGLAALGPVLPIGTTLTLPEMPKQAAKTVIRLWD